MPHWSLRAPRRHLKWFRNQTGNCPRKRVNSNSNRAAREAKYLHWHHAVLCQQQSEANAIAASKRFFYESIAKDVIKGETHYVAYDDPRMVFVADRQKNAFVLDVTSSRAVVLAVNGSPNEFQADDDADLVYGVPHRG